MILDTSYVVALAEGDTGAVDLASEHESAGVPQRLPAVVLSELYVSVGAGEDPNRNVSKYEQLVGNPLSSISTTTSPDVLASCRDNIS